jgi:hypothetical protein
MPTFRIFRMKEGPRQQFRWAPPSSGVVAVKPKDYEEAETVQGENLYALWASLRDTPRALAVGDILQTDTGELRIYKFIGFEEARWWFPEPKSAPEPHPESVPAPE